MKNYFVALFLFGISTAFSAKLGDQATNITVTSIGIHPSGDGYIALSNMTNYQGCTNGYAAILPKTNPQFNQIYAMILAAFSTGSNISLFVSGCASEPEGTFAKITDGYVSN